MKAWKGAPQPRWTMCHAAALQCTVAPAPRMAGMSDDPRMAAKQLAYSCDIPNFESTLAVASHQVLGWRCWLRERVKPE